MTKPLISWLGYNPLKDFTCEFDGFRMPSRRKGKAECLEECNKKICQLKMGISFGDPISKHILRDLDFSNQKKRRIFHSIAIISLNLKSKSQNHCTLCCKNFYMNWLQVFIKPPAALNQIQRQIHYNYNNGKGEITDNVDYYAQHLIMLLTDTLNHHPADTHWRATLKFLTSIIYPLFGGSVTDGRENTGLRWLHVRIMAQDFTTTPPPT